MDTVTADRRAASNATAIDEKSVLARGFVLLDAVSRAGRPLALAELAAVTLLPKSTVHRLSSQLLQLGLLDRVDEGFCLGLKMFEWGSRAERQRRLRTAALPFLTDTHHRLGETIHLAVLDSGDVVYIEKIEAHRAVRCPTHVGQRRPAQTTALGKAMLAFSPNPSSQPASLRMSLGRKPGPRVLAPGVLPRQLMQVREFGYSFELEESFVGVACVAAPICGADGSVLGAVSITTPPSRFNPTSLGPEARKISDFISRQFELMHPSPM